MVTITTLIQRRDLLWQFLSRNIKARYRGSWLGSTWLIANPLLMLCLYVFAFGIVFGGRFTNSPNESTWDYALGVFIGLNVIGLVSGVISSSPGVILAHPNFVRKVVFPLEILPVALVGALVFDLLIGFCLSLLGIVVLGPELAFDCLLSLFLLLPVILISLGLSLVLSALGVFLRDISHLSSFLSLTLLYSSGVFYSAEKAMETVPLLWSILQWNPLMPMIDCLRNFLLWRNQPHWWWVGYAWLFGIVLFFLGSFCFQRLRPTFGDVV